MTFLDIRSSIQNVAVHVTEVGGTLVFNGTLVEIREVPDPISVGTQTV
jgi:hypothetical protein